MKVMFKMIHQLQTIIDNGVLQVFIHGDHDEQ